MPKAERRNKDYFGGLMWKVMKRDNMICQECGKDCSSNFKHNIHHIDENPKHNSLDNLILLCVVCHAKKRTILCCDCSIKTKANSARQKRCAKCRQIAIREKNKRTATTFRKNHPNYYTKYKIPHSKF